MMPTIRSAESSGNLSTLRNTNQIPTTKKAKGSTKVPQPATCEMDWIHHPVTELRCDESRDRIVRNPTSARMIPTISSLRSLEILLHFHPDFEVVRRGLRDLLLVPERDVQDVDLELVDFDLDFVLLEIGLRAKI